MTLENLLKIRELIAEPFSATEFQALLKAGSERLKDANNSSLSFSSRFDLAYNASHSLALAALRFQGYRSEKRYLVFQCLAHTTTLAKTSIRIFRLCHEKRNLAEYEGHFEEDETLLRQLLKVSEELEAIIKDIKL